MDFSELGFDPYAYLENLDISRYTSNMDSLVKAPRKELISHYKDSFNFPLKNLKNRTKLLPLGELNHLLELYNLYYDTIRLRYKGYDDPDCSYENFKQLRLDSIVSIYFDEAIIILQNAITSQEKKVKNNIDLEGYENTKYKFIDADFDNMDRDQMESYFKQHYPINPIFKSLKIQSLLHCLYRLTEKDEVNGKVYLSKENLVKFILKGFYGINEIPKVFIENYSTNSTRFRNIYYDFYGYILDKNEIPLKPLKAGLVKVLQSCVSNIEQDKSLYKKIDSPRT